MRNLVLIIIISFSMVANGQNKDMEEIQKVMSLQEIAWNEGNIEQFMDGYWKSDSLMVIGKNGIKYGWQTTLDNYRVSYPDKTAMGKLNFEILKLEVNGNSAYILGKWKLIRNEDTPNGYFTLYWKKIEGKWVITIDHTS
ncbi:MAG: nuclear transport factor 2 family protein [Flavobacteriales bacterium]|nr:nuclear transport factor 2 family protein [Flavobacteriales bacterium]MCB9363914.1 nuclear transport factor 2 family protein [Flavobacteriales bacterium]